MRGRLAKGKLADKEAGVADRPRGQRVVLPARSFGELHASRTRRDTDRRRAKRLMDLRFEHSFRSVELLTEFLSMHPKFANDNIYNFHALEIPNLGRDQTFRKTKKKKNA